MEDESGELKELLADVERGLREQSARGQALAANSTLALLGSLDFQMMGPGKQSALVFDVFKLCSYAVGGMPVVLRALAVVHGTQENGLTAFVEALGHAFGVNPNPLIATMLGRGGDEAASVARGSGRDVA